MTRVTLGHIAEQVGVDRSTVSRALRNKSGEVGISAELTGRIIDAARDLNYSPNASARAVRSGRFDAAALLMSTQAGRSYLSTRMLDGIHDELAAREMHLTIAKVPDRKLSSEKYVPKILREFLSDGLIVNYTHQLPPHLQEVLERCRLPFVWLNADVGHDSVRADSLKAGRAATARMIAAGHRRVAYVDFCAGELELPTAHGSAADREAGYADAHAPGRLAARHLAAGTRRCGRCRRKSRTSGRSCASRRGRRRCCATSRTSFRRCFRRARWRGWCCRGICRSRPSPRSCTPTRG